MEIHVSNKRSIQDLDRAKRAQEVITQLLIEGAPETFWVAIRLDDGRTHGAAYPTKVSAMAHCQDPNSFAFMHIIAADGFPALDEIRSFLRYAEQKEAYWRAREDLNLHIPKAPLMEA